MTRNFLSVMLISALIFSTHLFAQFENVERIISYDSDITINEDGSMIVVETIKVYSLGDKIKRGIYRDFPTRYKDDYGNNIIIKFDVLEVLRDGVQENYHTENQNNGIRVYCGKSNYFLPQGEYAYTIKYKTDRQIGYFEKFDELYWNVTGNGWDFIIENVSATVTLPQTVSRDDIKLFGYTGQQGDQGKGYSTKIISSNKIYFQTTGILYPREGLTIVVQWPKGLVKQPTQTEKLLYFAEDNTQEIIGVAGIIILVLYYFLIWLRVGKDPKRGIIIPLFKPPDRMSPAAMRFISEMGYDNKTFTSVILSLSVKGYIRIDESDGDYTLVSSSGIKELTKDESIVLDKLGLNSSGIRNSLNLKQKNHSILQSAIKSFKKSLQNSYEKVYFVTNRKYFFIGLGISILILAISVLGGSGEQIFILIWISFWSAGVAALLFAVFKAWKGVLTKSNGKVTAIGGAIFISLFSIPFVGGEILGFYFLSQVSSPLMILVIALTGFTNIIFYHLLKAPTLLGRKIMDKIDGFKMYLGVAEKDEIYNMQAPDKTPELFETYLPYALALGVENHWAEKFSDILSGIKGDDYKPLWYNGTSWSTLGATGFTNSLSGSFSSSISSSSTAPGSSSGGGGGGSSGGGGGGGGGGGW